MKAYVHMCTESALSFPSAAVLEFVRETERGSVLPPVFLGINRGFCLQPGLQTGEPELGGSLVICRT